MHISDSEAQLQSLAKSLAELKSPEMTGALRHTLSLNLTSEEVMSRLCRAVSAYSNGKVQMRFATDAERKNLFKLEVFGMATYMILESNGFTYSLIITSNDVILILSEIN